jgi:phosphoribosyl 1,2-cyclic phosphate phosphodiesterase
MRLQLLAAKVNKLDAVILSHAHADHIMGMDDLRPFSLHTGNAVVIYAWEEVEAAVRRIYPYAFEDFPPGIFVPRFDIRRLEAFHIFGDIEVEILPVMHGKMRVAGLKVGRFAYLNDVNYIPDVVWQKIQDLDTLVLDAVRRRPHPHHFNLEQALKVAEQLAPKRTILTHLSDDYDHDVDNALLPPGVELGYDGLEFEVKV